MSDHWVYVVDEPCEWCAVWIGPHRHMLDSDGKLGAIISSIDEPEAARIRDYLAHPELDVAP